MVKILQPTKLQNYYWYKRYYHDLVGINSRLDSVQAAILNIKLKNLDKYNQSRRNSALIYNKLINSSEIIKPIIKYNENSHVFHQYTLRLTNGKRDEMVKFLNENDVPCGVYYPIPLHSQNAYKRDEYKGHKYFQDTVNFCEKYDQSSFDPNYKSFSLKFFKPIVKKIFARKPYSLL